MGWEKGDAILACTAPAFHIPSQFNPLPTLIPHQLPTPMLLASKEAPAGPPSVGLFSWHKSRETQEACRAGKRGTGSRCALLLLGFPLPMSRIAMVCPVPNPDPPLNHLHCHLTCSLMGLPGATGMCVQPLAICTSGSEVHYCGMAFMPPECGLH